MGPTERSSAVTNGHQRWARTVRMVDGVLHKLSIERRPGIRPQFVPEL